jgi:hypothetical protein
VLLELTEDGRRSVYEIVSGACQDEAASLVVCENGVSASLPSPALGFSATGVVLGLLAIDSRLERS